MMRYETFELTIFQGERDGRYHLRARTTTQGEARADTEIEVGREPFVEMAEIRKSATTRAEQERLGRALYGSLFVGDVKAVWNRSFGEVSGNPEVGLRLRLNVEPPELAVLAWELLYEPDRRRFLATSAKTPLSRHLGLNKPVREMACPDVVRLLAIVPETSELNVEAEHRNLRSIEENLAGKIAVDRLTGKATSRAIRNRLRQRSYQLVHFAGHGAFHAGEALIYLDGESEMQDRVAAADFAQLFLDDPSVLLLVLNACHGATRPAQEGLAGVAPQLLDCGVPAVVGMQCPITNPQALDFANEFYRELTSERWGGQVERAVARARNALFQQHPRSLSFAYPVLYLRAPDGRLWPVGKEAKDPDIDEPVPRPPVVRGVDDRPQLSGDSQPMTTTYLLRVLRDGHEVSRGRGTAWLVSPRLAVTAFHVVAGDKWTAWHSDLTAGVEYQLAGPDGTWTPAEPATAEPAADLALLRTATEIDGAEPLAMTDEPIVPGMVWRMVGFIGRERFALTGKVTAVLPESPNRGLKLHADQGTEFSWAGLSGAPVMIGGRVAATVTKDLRKAATLLAAPLTPLTHLLRLAAAPELADQCRELLADVYPAVDDLRDLTEELGWLLPSAVWTAPAAAADRISRRAWHAGAEAVLELLGEVEADVTSSPRPGELIRRVRELRRPPGSAPVTRLLRTQVVSEIIQNLGSDLLPGVALVEPLGFGARAVVNQVLDALREPQRKVMVVRLVPDRRTDNEARLYGALVRDLRRGLERELNKKKLPPEWSEPFPDPERTPDEETFERTVEMLVAGPVERHGRTLVLVVEQLSRVGAESLRSWAWLISRLSEELPLKVLVWGGRELHDLCTGSMELDYTSPFERLRRRKLEPLTRDEVRELAAARCGEAGQADVLYRVTGGHPALVGELLETATAELRRGDEAGLRARALHSAHLRRLRAGVERDPAAQDALAKMADGDFEWHDHPGEEILHWLGIVVEDGPSAWKWTAPVIKDWVAQWLDRD